MTQRNKSARQSIAIVRDLEDRRISRWEFLEFDIGGFCFRLAGDARAETVLPRITPNQDAFQRNDER